MPLDTATLKNSLKSAFLANLPSPNTDQELQIDTLAGAMADALQAFVETATITYSAGLIAPSGGGPVTGIFTNIIT